MATEAQIRAIVADEVRKVWGYKNAALTERDAYDLVRRPGLDVWEQTITRDGQPVTVKQELADTRTQVAAIAEVVQEILARLPKAEPQPEPAPVPALGIDVSKHQTVSEVVANLASSPDFCIVNATTGLHSVSPALDANRAAAREHANLVGFYHWSQTVNESATTPDKSDPLGEARHFVATIAAQPGDVLALDHEQALGTWEQRVSYAVAWLEEVKRLTGATPLVYVNWNWIKGLRTAATLEQWDRLTAFPLWLAEWTKVPGKFDTVTAKDGSSEDDWPVVVHQYDVIDDVDRNWTADLTALRALGVKG